MADEPYANTGFDPTFGDPLQKFLAAAKAQGIDAHIISGVRTDQDQAELQANAVATRAGRPLPYPERGPVPVAAPPGSSAHEFGLAADVQASNPGDQAKLIALGTSLGLAHPMSYDPTHFEAPNWRTVAANQPPPTPWDQTNPANVPTAYASNVSAPAAPAAAAINAAATPGMSINTTTPGSHADFIRNYAKQIGVDPNLALGIARSEGLNAWSPRNPNAASTVDVQNGQPFSFGDFQLNVHPGAMGAQALAQNIDPRDPNQWQAADRFALDQLKAGGAGPWKGDPVAAAYLKTGAVPQPAVAGATGAIDPTIAAGGPGALKPAVTPGMNAGDWLAKLTTPGAGGQSPLQKAIGDAGKLADANQQSQQGPAPDQQLQAQQAAAGMGMQRQQQIAQQAQQMMAANLQRAQQPLSWGSAPPGSMPGASAGQAPQINPQAIAAQMMMAGRYPGTTLNSIGDYGYG